MNYFIDTNICIYFLKGIHSSIKKRMEQIPPENIKIATIVKAELLFGVKNSTRKKTNLELLKKFLLPFEIIPFDDKATNLYSKIRFDLSKKGMLIGPNDLILASTVMAEGSTLITNNIKEFSRVKNLKVDNWIK